MDHEIDAGFDTVLVRLFAYKQYTKFHQTEELIHEILTLFKALI